MNDATSAADRVTRTCAPVVLSPTRRFLAGLLHKSGLLTRAIHWYAFRRLFGRRGSGDLWRLLGARIDESALIGPGVDIRYPENVTIGPGSGLRGTIWIDAWGPVYIGANVLINDNVRVLTAGHDVDDPAFRGLVATTTIEDWAWLPQNIIVMPGVTIGEAAVVGTGSVVSRSVPPRAIVAGNPARTIGERADVGFSYEPARR